MKIQEQLAKEFQVKLAQVENTIALIDEGNTIPFIARYRKEATGALTDVQLRDIGERLSYLRGLEERKEEVKRLIAEQGKLTEELSDEIDKAEVLQRVEDLYKPYKQKKATRASKAREKGLEPLALLLLAQKEEASSPEEAERVLTALAEPFVGETSDAAKAAAEAGAEPVKTAAEALAGACDIIAERISDDAEMMALVREMTQKSGQMVSEAVDPEEKTVYDMYYAYSEGFSKIPNHRVLAVNRGEKEKKLKVKVTAPVETILSAIAERIVTNEKAAARAMLSETIADAYKRLIAPPVEREMRNLLTERAEAEATKIFAKNTEKLLMMPPVAGARIISIDPGYRTGCKVAVLNETGKLLAYTTIYPTEPKKDIAGTEKVLEKLIEKFRINTIVIGNGTASRETEEVVADFLGKHSYDVRYTIVNEAGASVYSASKLATEEYPDLDVTTRGAMSLGRRLQDPLAELVKISPKSIGVGQYQHDINQTLLDTALTNVVEDCVNRVGVDLNTASPSLLSYIAGINMAIAKNIVAYREENGAFTDRRQLLKVSKLGEKTYRQCAGFLRIKGGKNPFDATAVHPESYKTAEQMLEKLGIEKEAIARGGARDIEQRICEVYREEKKSSEKQGRTVRAKGLGALSEISREMRQKEKEEKDSPKRELAPAIRKMAGELGVGEMTLSDIVEEMRKPARDPREDAPPVIFRNDVRRFEDLKVDMEMTGTVRNVVDFGAFVDIGVKNDGLVHISQLSDRYVKHPLDVVSVGDTVKVKIISIDPEKQKVGLTMKGLRK